MGIPNQVGTWEVESLSARRAWIEITSSTFCSALFAVALRKESVDRNIPFDFPGPDLVGVALRKESVDRNISREISLMRPYGRSPQGERG